MPVQRNRLVVVATQNAGKIREIRKILQPCQWELVSITEFAPEFHVTEDGTTYAENAIKKARAAAACTGLVAIADDSGLEVDALEGAPGLYSARFGGPHLTQGQKNRLLLQQLDGKNNRSARFRCVMAVVASDTRCETAEGICEGVIATEERGTAGFGFDPIFVVPEYSQTMAELGPVIKNIISHRAKAVRKMKTILQRLDMESGGPGGTGWTTKTAIF